MYDAWRKEKYHTIELAKFAVTYSYLSNLGTFISSALSFPSPTSSPTSSPFMLQRVKGIYYMDVRECTRM